VNQIKEQIKAIGDFVEEEEMVMTTLNGLPRSWDAFIQGICSRKKLPKFSRLWEDCNQEEARTSAREEKMANEDQALAAHTRKGKNKKEHSLPKKFKMGQRDNSKMRCYCCQELGYFVRDCPLIMEIKNKKGSKRHQAHTTEDDEPPKKVAKQDESSDEEYILITGTVTYGSDTWLIDSGASKHMKGYEDSLSKLIHKDSSHKVLENKTPEEMFLGEKPEVSHFRILAALYLFTSLRKRGQSWTLLDRRAYLLVTVTHQRLIGYIFLVTGKWRSTEM
jgi:hypothetical protein